MEPLIRVVLHKYSGYISEAKLQNNGGRDMA